MPKDLKKQVHKNILITAKGYHEVSNDPDTLRRMTPPVKRVIVSNKGRVNNKVQIKGKLQKKVSGR